MLKALRKLLWGEEETGLETPQNERATFVLEYEELVLGILRLADGKWEFEYSPEFVTQLKKPGAVKPLVDFPDPNKTYVSRDLWPFFLSRIPSLSQPAVREEVDRQNLDPASETQLLRAFGKRSIANPFELTPQG